MPPCLLQLGILLLLRVSADSVDDKCVIGTFSENPLNLVPKPTTAECKVIVSFNRECTDRTLKGDITYNLFKGSQNDGHCRTLSNHHINIIHLECLCIPTCVDVLEAELNKSAHYPCLENITELFGLKTTEGQKQTILFDWKQTGLVIIILLGSCAIVTCFTANVTLKAISSDTSSLETSDELRIWGSHFVHWTALASTPFFISAPIDEHSGQNTTAALTTVWAFALLCVSTACLVILQVDDYILSVYDPQKPLRLQWKVSTFVGIVLTGSGTVGAVAGAFSGYSPFAGYLANCIGGIIYPCTVSSAFLSLNKVILSLDTVKKRRRFQQNLEIKNHTRVWFGMMHVASNRYEWMKAFDRLFST